MLAPTFAPAPINNYLPDTYVIVKPVTAMTSAGGGLSTGAIVGIVIAVVVVVGIVVWLVLRRRGPKEMESA